MCFSDEDVEGGSGDGEGGEYVPAPVDEPHAPELAPLPSLSTLLHELLQGLLDPWTHRATPDSSSGSRQMPSRLQTPLQTFLHGIFGRDRWRPRGARHS